jgi:hypothetical protein
VAVEEEHSRLLDKLLVEMVVLAVAAADPQQADQEQELLAQYKDIMAVLEQMIMEQHMLQAAAVVALDLQVVIHLAQARLVQVVLAVMVHQYLLLVHQ